MKTILSKSLFSILSAFFFVAVLFSCFGSDDDGKVQTGQHGIVTFWTKDLFCNDIRITIDGSNQFQSITEEYLQNEIECNADGCANFSLTPGMHTYIVYCGTQIMTEGEILIETGGCNLQEIDINIIYPNTLVGDWEMVSFDNGIPVGEEAYTYSENCPWILMWREAESGSYHFTEDTFTFVWNNRVTQTNIDFDPATCEIFQDAPDTQHEGTQTGHGTYQYHINLEGIELYYIESEIPGEVVPLEFLSSDRIRIYDQEFVKL